MTTTSSPDTGTNNGTVRGQGRKLEDFIIDTGDGKRGYYPAEQELLDAAMSGMPCVIADARPEEKTQHNRLRASFIRFLILGAGEEIFIHERGVQLQGGYIEGPLELDHLHCQTPLKLEKCLFEQRIVGVGAHFVALTLDGSRSPGVNLGDARFSASVSMANGFQSDGEVRLTGAHIGGDLNFAKAKLVNPGEDALGGRGLYVGRNVFLTDGFFADGRVRFSNAEIGGDLICFGAHFMQRSAATQNDPKEGLRAEYALSLTNVVIKSVLWIGPWNPPLDQHVRIEGSLNLQGTYAATLADDEKSWPVSRITTADGKKLPCTIALDGFVYDRLRATSPTKAHIRRRWLLRATQRRGETVFRPQPFEQLISVLQKMGLEKDARQIGLLKEQHLQKVRLDGASFFARPFFVILGLLWGGLTGYGYRPHRLVVMLALLWMASAAFFYAAEKAGGFAPSDPEIWIDGTIAKECEAYNWTVCPRVARLIPFNAVTYAADTILPIVDLQQRSNWSPVFKSLRMDLPYFGEQLLPAGGLYIITWLVSIFGATGAILLGVIMSGLVKRD